MRKFSTAILTLSSATAFYAASTFASLAQDIGLVSGSFAATYVQTSSGCSSLLVTGQFMAPTPEYKITLTPNGSQSTALLLQLDVSIVAPTGNVAQVVTLTAIEYFDPSYDGCHYGVAIVYEKQKEVVGLSPAAVRLR